MHDIDTFQTLVFNACQRLQVVDDGMALMEKYKSESPENIETALAHVKKRRAKVVEDLKALRVAK